MGPKNKGAVTISTKEDFSSTPLSDIFRGYLRSRVVRSGQAHESNNISESVQPFFTLQLDIEVSILIINVSLSNHMVRAGTFYVEVPGENLWKIMINLVAKHILEATMTPVHCN